MAGRLSWSPSRGDMIWINCSPQVGREMKGRTSLAGTVSAGIQYAHRHRDRSADDDGALQRDQTLFAIRFRRSGGRSELHPRGINRKSFDWKSARS